MTHLPKLLTGVSLAAIAASGVLAQDATGARETFLGSITLDGQENPTSPLDSPVARAAATTKTARPILETQASVSVIPRAQIEAQGATNLAEALTYSAGIIAENYGSDPRFDSLFLRGFNLENDKFLDGLRLMRSTEFPTSAPAFELYGIERIEVLRGPASVLYGAGTPAGLVNLVQKRAQASGDFTEMGTSVDTNGSAAIFGDANRVVDDRFAYRVTGKLGNSKTDVEDIDNERAYLGLSASYALSDSTELELMASYHDDAPISPTGVPTGLIGTFDSRDLRGFYFGDDSVTSSDRKMGTLSFGLTHDFGNGWKLNNTFRYTNFDWAYAAMYISGTAGTSVDRGIISQDESFISYANDLRLSGRVSTGNVDHNLTIGIDAQKFEEKAYTGFSFSTAIDYTAPTYGGLSIGAPWYTADKTVKAEQVGIYVLDEIEAGNWRATLGLRHEWTRQSGARDTNFGTTDFARKDQHMTGTVGLGYVWDSGLASYLSYATSYLPQPGFAIDGSALNPTEGQQWELGLKYDPATFDGFFSAALFHLEETDRNTSVTETIGGGTINGVRQIGKARIQGLELEAVADLSAGWALKGAYTFTDTKISGDNDGNELANTPRHAASLWLTHRFQGGALEGLTLGGGLRHIGSRWTNDANTARLDAVTLVDLSASYDWDNGMQGRLSVSNLTDEAYVSAVGLGSSYFSDGRTVQASLTYKW